MNDEHALLEDDDLPDPALRRALENAPDHAAVPNFHLRKTIRQMAHHAVGPSDAELTELLDRSWWRQLLGLGAPKKSRTPWRAAFATVLVGVFVTVLWQRQPMPGSQLDSQAPGKSATSAPTAPTAPTAPSAKDEASAPASAAGATAANESAPQIALPPTVPAARELPPAPPEAPTALPQPTARDIAIQAALRKAQEAEREAQEVASKAVPIPGMGVARAPNPAGVAPPAAASRRADERAPASASAGTADRRSARARDELAAAAPPPMAAPAPAPMMAAPQKAANATAGATPSSPVRTDASEPPTFAALGQWTRMTVIGPNGQSRTYSRSEAADLGTLVGSAALAAVGPQPLRNKVEWRVMLERNGKPLAQFELARGEVRWREGGSTPATGQPPEGALDGLREALRDAVAPLPAASNQPAPAQPAVPPAEPQAPQGDATPLRRP